MKTNGQKKNKTPKYDTALTPPNRSPRVDPRNSPESFNAFRPAWKLRQIDVDGTHGWSCISGAEWWADIYPKLRDYETMTWSEILQANGGKSVGHGTNSHSIPKEKLCTAARNRLKEIGLDDIDEVFSLRLTGRKRIWGIREENVLKILWYDPDHKICPSHP